MISKKVRIVNSKENDKDMTESELSQVPDGYLTEVFACDVFETSQDENIINTVCNKVRKNGKLTVQGIDCYDLCRSVYQGNLKIEDSSNYFSNIKRMNSLYSLKSLFTSMNWKILFTSFKNGRYFIEVQKP